MEGAGEREGERKGRENGHSLGGWKVVQARRPPRRRHQKGHVETEAMRQTKTEPEPAWSSRCSDSLPANERRGGPG